MMMTRGWVELCAFVASQGGLVGPLQPETHGSLRGLYTTRPVDAGEPLLGIPACCSLSSENGLGEVTVGGSSLKAHERLIVSLLREKQSPSPLCELYLPTLPDSIPLLRDWSEHELHELQSPSIVEEVASQLEHVERSLERLAPQLEPLYPCSSSRRDAFLWAESVVRSRALSDGRGELVLWPLFDLANHASPRRPRPVAGQRCDEGAAVPPEEPLRPVMLMSDGFLVLRAASAMGEREEISFSYGDEGNGGLLRDYGFAELLDKAQPGTEVLRLSVPLPCAPGVIVVRTGSASLDRDAVAAVRAAIRRCSARGAGAGPQSKLTLAREQIRDELAVCEALQAACARAMREAGSTYEEDLASLAALDSGAGGSGGAPVDANGRRRSALHYRLAQKRQLRATGSRLDAFARRLALALKSPGADAHLWSRAARPRALSLGGRQLPRVRSELPRRCVLAPPRARGVLAPARTARGDTVLRALGGAWLVG